MKTEKLYQKDVYRKNGTALLLDVIANPAEIAELGGKGDAPCLVLNQTVFFPEGGGQPSDQGTIEGKRIAFVFERDGVVYHQLEKGEGWSIRPGAQLESQIDWDRRFRNMQRHCGEHILSAAFYDLCGGVNRGFHMGEDHMTIDISLEENPDCTEMTDEWIRAVELRANQYIWEDAPITTVFCNTREEAERYPMRKKLQLEKDITLVCVGDPENASGRVACCGTHPSSAGQVGVIKIYGYEKNKGMFRIYCEAGRDAFTRYCLLGDVVKKLGRKYSADETALQEKIEAQEQKNKEMRQEFFELRKICLAEKAEEICGICGLREKGKKVFVREFPQFKVDDLLNLCKQISEEVKTLIALVSEKENTVILLCHGSVDCNKLIKDNAGVWNGKGGGRPDCARVMFSGRDDLDCFLEYLKKSYEG